MKALLSRVKMFWKYKDLIKQLVMKDIKLKYRRSFLGYVWSILNPLLIMVVMTVVFSSMFKNSIENYPVYLFTGQVLFNFMSQSTHQAIHSVTGNGILLRKTYIPKYLFTFSKITSGLVDFIFSLGALVIVMLVTRATFYPTMLLMPVVALQLYVFCIGLGLFLAQANVFFRDIQYIYNAVTTAWTYLTPIFYPISELSENLAKGITAFNPMYFYIVQFRDIIYYGKIPESNVFLKGSLAAGIMLILGVLTFWHKQDEFVLYI